MSKPRASIKVQAARDPYAQWNFRISLASLIIQILGFFTVIWTIHESTRVFQRSVYTDAVGWVIELDKEFLAHPQLRPYFYEGKPVVPGDADYNQAVLMAEYILDSYDTFLEHRLSSVNQPIHNTWLIWMHDMFSTSPILQQYILDHKTWYDDGKLYQLVYLKWVCEQAGKPVEECREIERQP
jgi:hypothetical protein